MTDKTSTTATATNTPAASDAPAPPGALAAATRKTDAAALAKPATTGVGAMPKAWHADQAAQRATDTRFDGSRFRRKQDA